MNWQDIAILIITVCFGLTIAPALRKAWHGEQTNRVLNLTYLLGSFGLAFVFWTLGLYLSMAANGFVGFMWSVLFLINVRQR